MASKNTEPWGITRGQGNVPAVPPPPKRPPTPAPKPGK